MIEWTKDFAVSHDNGAFKIFVSRHGNTSYYASLLYYQKKTAVSAIPQSRGIMDFHLHTEFGSSEKEALDKLKAWMNRELPGNYSMSDTPKMREIGITARLG